MGGAGYKPSINKQTNLATGACAAVNAVLGRVCRLLTLWFDYGQWPDVYEALTEGIKSIQIDNWLQVNRALLAPICCGVCFCSSSQGFR